MAIAILLSVMHMAKRSDREWRRVESRRHGLFSQVMRKRCVDYSGQPLIARVCNPVNSRRQAGGSDSVRFSLLSPRHATSCQRAPVSINLKVDAPVGDCSSSELRSLVCSLARSRAKNAVTSVLRHSHDLVPMVDYVRFRHANNCHACQHEASRATVATLLKEARGP